MSGNARMFKTIAGTYTSGYTLAARYAGLSITNKGSVSSPNSPRGGPPYGQAYAAGVAVTLPDGGSLSNQGTIHGGTGGAGYYFSQEGGNNSYGDGGDGGSGVLFSASGSIDSQGAILGGKGGAGSRGPVAGQRYTFSINGYVGGAGGDGITLAASGSITNSGSIEGGAGGAGGLGGPGGYTKSGTGVVTPGAQGGGGGAGGTGILAQDGGDVTNYGVIKGGAGGNAGAGGSNPIQQGPGGNGGAGGAGVVLVKAGDVVNQEIIEGAGGGGGGSGVASGAKGRPGNGVVLQAGGSVTNGPDEATSALIQGYQGVIVRGAAGTVTNYASISGTATGSVRGGVALYDGGTVANQFDAQITGREGVTVEGAAGDVTNMGEIESSFASSGLHGVWLQDGGSVTNGSSTDDLADIESFQSGVAAASGYLTVHNYGYIGGEEQASGQAGISAALAGYVYNGSSSDSAAEIRGRNGVLITDRAVVFNFATIEGSGATAGFGVAMNGGGYFWNGPDGQVSGYGGLKLDGDGVNLGVITGAGSGRNSYYGTYGVRLNGSSTLTNDKNARIDGYTGVEVSGAGTVINSGAIDTTAREAVFFETSEGTLIVEGGSSFNGGVYGHGGALVLGSGTGTLSGLSGGYVTVSASMPTATFGDFASVKVGVSATFTLSTDGTISSGDTLIDAGTLSVGKTLVIDGALTSTGTLAGAGTLSVVNGTAAFDTGTSLTISDIMETGNATTATVGASSLDYAGVWTQKGGTLSVSTGDRVNFSGTGDAFEGTLSGAGTVAFVGGADSFTGAHLTAATLVVNGAAATLSGSLDLSGTMSVTSDDLVIAGVGASLAGGGALVLTNLATNKVSGGTLTNVNDYIKGAGQLGDGSMGLINDAGGIIDGDDTVALTINTGSSTITNAGRIEAAPNGLTTVASAVDNTGVLAAFGGTLTFDGAVTGTGKAEIDGGAADFAGAFTQNVAFLGVGGGTLELAHSEDYTGAITGFSRTGTTALDLEDIPFVSGVTKASYSGTTTSGVLTVADGSHVAKITLEGNYLASVFKVSSDGHGGTKVVDPTAISAQRFIAAAASLGPSEGLAHESAEIWRPPAAPMLMAPALA